MGEIKPSEISAIIRQQLSGFSDKTSLEETGVVLEVGDGIARVYGLTNAQSGELIYFEKDAAGLSLIIGSIGTLLTAFYGSAILRKIERVQKDKNSAQ